MKTPETNKSRKYFILFETDAEGIRNYKSAPKETRIHTSISNMHVGDRIVPAIKLEVDKTAYDIFKQEQWKNEHRFRQENRCVINGAYGRSRICPGRLPVPPSAENSVTDKPAASENNVTAGNAAAIENIAAAEDASCDCCRCPYGRMFQNFCLLIPLSAFTVPDSDGTEIPGSLISPDLACSPEAYEKLLCGFIEYIRKNCPRHPDYANLVELLGQEYTLSEVAAILQKSYRTLYGWLRKLRPVFDEYLETVDFI